MLTTSEFRKRVREAYPHVKVSVRTTDFTDLARSKAKCLEVTGDRNIDELVQINAWATEAGILPDRNVRSYAHLSLEIKGEDLLTRLQATLRSVEDQNIEPDDEFGWPYEIAALRDAIEFTKAVQELLSDVDTMRVQPEAVREAADAECEIDPESGHWFGFYGTYVIHRQTYDPFIEWPNLSIAVTKVAKLLANQTNTA